MKQLQYYLWRAKPEANLAYLALRIFVGIAMFTHGIGKLTGGPDSWRGLGRVMGSVGIPGPAVFWGFMAAFAESIGAVLLTVGLLTPVASFLIAVTMTVAVFVAHAGDPFSTRELGLMFLFTAVLFMFKGAGSYSVDRWLPQRR
ncbi:MAG: DoxX family protein [Kiritimatiellia bacterium]